MVGRNKPHHAESACLRDVDRRDRRHGFTRRCEAVPYAEPLENKSRAMRKRERTVASRRRSLRAGIEPDDIEVGIAQCERQPRSEWSGTDDDEIAEHRAFGD